MCVAVLVGAVLQSAAGFGFALVIAPALFAALEPGEALTLESLLSLVLSSLVLFGERREHEVRWSLVAPIVAWSLPGLVVGAVVLGLLGKPVLQVAVGVAVAAVAARALLGPDSDRGRAWRVAPVGVVTGALSSTVGINGPPLLVLFHRAGLSPAATRDTLAACFLALGPLTVAVLAVAGQVTLGHVSAALVVGLLALVVVGRALGRGVFLRLAPEQFRRAGMVLALAAGLASVVAGLAAA